MKKKNLTAISLGISFLIAIVVLTGCKSKAELFGQPIANKTTTPIKNIVMKPADYNDKTVTIEGKLTTECPSGCWFDLQQDAAVLRVDIAPSDLAIPQKVGSSAIVEGTVKVQDGQPVLIGTGVEIK